MKYILSALLFISSVSFGQSFVPADTCFNNVVSLITATTARINTNTGNGDVLGTFVVLKYVRVGHTDTITSSAAWPNGLRNLTGLVPSTQYVYYYGFSNGPEWVPQFGRYTFTTLANTITYTPQFNNYQYPYIKFDSGIKVPRRDTTLGRAPNTGGGDIVFKSPYFYGYNGTYWQWLGVDSAGILPALNLKVDSVTVYGDSLFYWIQGISYGWILPTGTPFDATVDFSVNADPNDPGTTFNPNTPQLTTKIYVSTIDGSQWTWNSNLLTYVIYHTISWGIFGNAGTDPATNFVGTTDEKSLVFKVAGTQAGIIEWNNDNTSIGYQTLKANVSGTGNTVMGAYSMDVATTGSNNTSLGVESSGGITTGSNNISIGAYAGQSTSTQSNRLFINSINRGTILDDSTKSIIYGAQDATAANQRLYLNAKTYIPYMASGVGTKAVRINPSTGLLTYADTTTGGSSAITIGTTTITSGTNTNVLYNNSGVVGEYTTTGSGTELVKSANPTFASGVTSLGSWEGDNRFVYFKRTVNTAYNGYNWSTGGVSDFFLGTRETGDNDCHLFMYGLGADAVVVARATGAITFSNLAGTGNRIVTASSAGVLSATQTATTNKFGSFSGVGTATTVFTVTFGGTLPNATYSVNVTPTAALSAALFYVTNKTTTTFDVTYLAGLTGTVTFDWTLVQ